MFMCKARPIIGRRLVTGWRELFFDIIRMSTDGYLLPPTDSSSHAVYQVHRSGNESIKNAIGQGVR